MRLRFAFRSYRLPLNGAVRTAHGRWTEREGLIVRIEDEQGRVGFGEVAPIAWFGTETIEDALAACQALGEWVDGEVLGRLPESLRCVRQAMAAAMEEIGAASAREESGSGGDAAAEAEEATTYLAMAALLPAGRAVLAAIEPKAEMGFRVFKWKVGVGDVADELALLDDVCGKLPEGAKLRLDANGAWDRRRAERWLERCADRPVEFVEQPVAGDARGAQDLLMGLAGDFPTTIALDESISADADVQRWLGAGWRGVFVVKTSLLADARETLGRLSKAKADVVFSSALETAVGAKTALRRAFRWRGKKRALGFGVWPLFADRRFDGPALAPFVRREDVERIDVEAVWNALG